MQHSTAQFLRLLLSIARFSSLSYLYDFCSFRFQFIQMARSFSTSHMAPPFPVCNTGHLYVLEVCQTIAIRVFGGSQKASQQPLLEPRLKNSGTVSRISRESRGTGIHFISRLFPSCSWLERTIPAFEPHVGRDLRIRSPAINGPEALGRG
jgi:hypothetical protein